MNTLAVVGVFSFLLSINYLIPTTAFNAIISLQAMALSVSYIPPILFLALCRIRRDQPQPWLFDCGRFDLVINLFTLVYLVFIIIWMPFPQVLPITKDHMNCAGPFLGAVIVGALIDWVIGGHKGFEVSTARTM